MNESCRQLEEVKARLIRLEHGLQGAQTRMSAAHQHRSHQSRQDFADASAAVRKYRSQLSEAVAQIAKLTLEAESFGADPELLEEDLELAQISALLASGNEVVPFSEEQDYLVAESAAAGFGSDIVYRAHLDPLTIMLQEAGYDIMDVSPEARMEAQLKELEDAGFLGDFGADTPLPKGRRRLRRLVRRLRRQESRLARRIRRLPKDRRGNLRRDPITQDLNRRMRRRLTRVRARLADARAALREAKPTQGGRPPRTVGRIIRPPTAGRLIRPVGPGPVASGRAEARQSPVLTPPGKDEFNDKLRRHANIPELSKAIRKIRLSIRKARGLSTRYQSRLKRDQARAAQVRRKITRARRRAVSLPGSGSNPRRRQLARIIGRLNRRLQRINERIVFHTKSLALAARAVPRWQAHLKRAQAALAELRQVAKIQSGASADAQEYAKKKEALEYDAQLKDEVAEKTAEVSNTAVVAADNEALRDAAEATQAELATKAEAGASGKELAELSGLVGLLTEAINSQMPELIEMISSVSQADLTPVFTEPAVPDQDVPSPSVEGPTAILPTSPSDPITAPTEIADQGLPVPDFASQDTSREYRVHAVADPIGQAAASYHDEQAARLDAQLAMLAEQGISISGDTSFLNSHAPSGLWEDGVVDEFESGDVHMGADPWDQFGNVPPNRVHTVREGWKTRPPGLSDAAWTNVIQGAGGARAGQGAGAPSGGEVFNVVKGVAGVAGDLLGNILPWVTNQGPRTPPFTVSDNQNRGGNVVTQTPPPQVIYVPGNDPMSTGAGGNTGQEPPKDYTPLIIAGGLGLVLVGGFTWAATR